jgi:uncharacterized protein (TIGR02453 family)
MRHILPFLEKLKSNNNRDWFLANRKEYELAREELITFAGLLIPKLLLFDKKLEGLNARDCLFRINRDTRFSGNKEPYKTNMGAVFSPGGKKSGLGCYYVHIEPGKSFLAGGVYLPEGPALKKIREEIDYNLPEFESILHAPSFTKTFGELDRDQELKSAPKGYPKDHPGIGHLKNKSFTASCMLKDAEISGKKFAEKTAEAFSALFPFNAFLNRALE